MTNIEPGTTSPKNDKKLEAQADQEAHDFHNLIIFVNALVGQQKKGEAVAITEQFDPTSQS